MVTTRPNISMTGRYSIGEAAELLGIHRNTMRHYAKNGIINFSLRKQPCRKFFKGADLLRFWDSQYK